MDDTTETRYLIPQLKQAYNRERYPAGSEIILRLCSMAAAKMYGLKQLVSEGTIIRYVAYDDDDNAYDQIEIQWRKAFSTPVTNIMMLQNIILASDKEEYQRQDAKHRAIKLAMLESGVASNLNVDTWEDWDALNMDMPRKVALIKAGVPISNIATYESLTLEELTSLKHYLHAMERND